MSYSVADLDRRHCLRKKGKCKIRRCKQRGRFNYGKEYFYHGFCKDHYSLYQEGIIDFHGKPIREKKQGSKTIEKTFPLRKKGKRWNKADHICNNLRCKVVGCERDGEKSHGKNYYYHGFCSYHYREWYLKGFMDVDGNLILKVKEQTIVKDDKITAKMIKKFKMAKFGLC